MIKISPVRRNGGKNEKLENADKKISYYAAFHCCCEYPVIPADNKAAARNGILDLQ